MLPPSFFDRDACTVARDLLGKVIRRKYNQQWLAARIIETEAYYLQDKGSHDGCGLRSCMVCVQQAATAHPDKERLILSILHCLHPGN
jgi:hypothetical protein